MNFHKLFLIRFITLKYYDFITYLTTKSDSYYQKYYINYNDNNDCNRWLFNDSIV